MVVFFCLTASVHETRQNATGYLGRPAVTALLICYEDKKSPAGPSKRWWWGNQDVRKPVRSEAEGLDTHILFQFDLTAAVSLRSALSFTWSQTQWNQGWSQHAGRSFRAKQSDSQLDVTCVHLYLLWLKSSGRIQRQRTNPVCRYFLHQWQ